MTKIFTALDIGSNSIKGLTVELKKDNNFYVLNAFQTPSAGLRRGVIIDVEDLIPILRDVIFELKKISKKTLDNVFVNINGELIKLVPSRGAAVVSRADQKIQEDDLNKVLEAAKAVRLPSNFKVIDIVPYEYIVDEIGGIIDPLGMYGNKLEVNSVVIEIFEPYINNIKKVLKKVGVNVSFLGFNPLVAEKSILTKKQKELGTVLIDFGAGTTSLIVFYEGKIVYAKSFNAGSNDVTSDIALGLKIPFELAENLKVNYGCAFSKEISQKDKINLGEFDSNYNFEISRKFLSDIIQCRIEEILELINNDLKKIGRSLKLAGGIFIVGGGAKLRGLEELVRQELKLNTLMGVPNLERFEINSPIYESLLIDPAFAVVVGLILAGVDKLNEEAEERGKILEFFKNFLP